MGESCRGPPHCLGGRRLEPGDELGHRHAGNEMGDGHVCPLAGPRQVHPDDSEPVPPDDHRVAIEPHVTAPPRDVAPHRVPHHPGSQARILESVDQGPDRISRANEHASDRGPEGEVLDPLRRPFRLELGARHAPDLLGVRLEEGEEEPSAEAVGDPLLEGVFPRIGRQLPLEMAQHQAATLIGPQAPQDVPGKQRIVEVLPVVVDPGESFALEQIGTESLAPDPLYRSRLGEEAVPADVEAEAPVVVGAREPAEPAGFFQQQRRRAHPGELARGGQPGGPAPDHHDARHRVLRHPAARSLARC